MMKNVWKLYQSHESKLKNGLKEYQNVVILFIHKIREYIVCLLALNEYFENEPLIYVDVGSHQVTWVTIHDQFSVTI